MNWKGIKIQFKTKTKPQFKCQHHEPILFWIKYLFVFRSDSKGTITSKELSEASALADSINKAIKVLETKNMIDEQSK